MSNFKGQKLGTKIMLTILLIWGIGSSLLIFMSYMQISNVLMNNIKSKLYDYATLGVLGFSGEDHSVLRNPKDESTIQYSRILSVLRKIKSGSPQIKYVYTMRMNDAGKPVFIVDSTEDEDNFSPLGEVYEDSSPLLLEALQGLDGAVVEKDYYQDAWGTLISAYAPIRLEDGSFDGILGIDISIESVNKILLEHISVQLIFLITSFILVIPVAIILSKSLVNPIIKCVDFTKQLAKSDYTLNIPKDFLRRRDEVGDLTRAYDIMVSSTRTLIDTIQKQSIILSGIGIELESDMKNTSDSIKEISTGIQQIKTQTGNQYSSVSNTISTMEEITKRIETLAIHVSRQVESMDKSSIAVEEVLENIASVTRALAENSEDVGELSMASGSGKTDLAAVTNRIREVAKESEGLLEISDVIQSIASQTNLLSMNAAIEAAHAGEAGRGFSVVADEIRKLAESSGTQAKSVSTSLKKMKEAMILITNDTETVQEKFESIDGKIKQVSDREQEIHNAMHKQNEGGKSVLDTIRQLNALTEQVKTGFGMMMENGKAIIGDSISLNKITEEVTGNVNKMASEVGNIAEAVKNVHNISMNNKDSIDALKKEVGVFTI